MLQENGKEVDKRKRSAKEFLCSKNECGEGRNYPGDCGNFSQSISRPKAIRNPLRFMLEYFSEEKQQSP